MEGEKYNLNQAQEKIEELPQKVESGDIQDHEEIIISQFGLVREHNLFQTISRLSIDKAGLKRFSQFVELLSEKGFDPTSILSQNHGLFGIWHDEEKDHMSGGTLGAKNTAEFNRFKEWQTIITDSEKLNEVLGVLEAAFTHGVNPRVFIDGIGKRFIQEATQAQLEQLSEQIAAISDQANAVGGSSYRQEVASKIFISLNYAIFAERIKTPEDFRRYADKVMDIAKLHLRQNEEGEIVSGQGEAASKTADNVAGMTWLFRDNFDHDFDTIFQMMRNDPSISGVFRGIHDFIKTSEDLERFSQFVELLSEKGFDPTSILSQNHGLFGIWHDEEKDHMSGGTLGAKNTAEFNRFKEWQTIITDSEKLNEVLGVLEAAFTYGEKPNKFAERINQMPIDERGAFMQLARKFTAKKIPPQFVLDNLPLLQDCNFSKDGLALFSSFEAQKKWLEYCVQAWKKNPQNIDNVAKFFNEAVVSETIALPARELADIQENINGELESVNKISKPNEQLRAFASKLLQSALGELYEDKNFEAIIEIQQSINGSVDTITVLDQSKASALTQNELIKFIPLLGEEKASKLFPLTFDKAREMIFSKLPKDQDLADYFVENLDKYYQQPWVAENVIKAIQEYSVAQKFVYAVENDQAIWKDQPWVADIFSKAKAKVVEHQSQWDQNQDDDWHEDTDEYGHGNQGFSESDSYENHPWRFGGRQIRIALTISKMMTGQVDVQEIERLGINAKEVTPLLTEINKKVDSAYNNFLEQIRSNISIKDEDKQSLLNPELSSVKMTPLLDNVRAFVARYCVQSVEGDVTKLSEIENLIGDIDRIIKEGFKLYIKVHEVDVPLYDKLYEEFDNLRETGRYPLEVFLGRDGIYAWIGRRAQDVARRRKLGPEGRKKLKERGEVIEIHPQYTVYPRYFRDNINYETKRQFLEQEGISPDADPLFYDTGYTGTIPEQIMKVMDFEQEDIENRIRLLSAPSVHRRVKGIAKNARSEIIEYIEHNAKLEKSAEGLMVDEKTGKIRHIAMPTNPEEQFYFMMIKQAITRHYWLQEKLHHEPSGNVNLDSEHFTIRIRQDYAKLLPQEFIHDPKEFLTKQGELLKGSKGKGKYPDEEIILFKLTDGTEIVAKRIELRKTKEARKEFTILIAAKKAGLPTAEPVGFLSGKEDADGNYLLMKNLEGRSGRKFEKELKESGKYSGEQIKAIMQQVVEKNKQMIDLFRTTLKIDKRWRIKDTIIKFNEETGEVENVVPIDWERA